MGKALIVLNGTPPSKHLLQALAWQADLVVAADGGARCLLSAGMWPHAVVGDLDSFPAGALSEESGTQVVHVPEQDTTDAEKALRWTLENSDHREVALTATLSPDIDHVLATLSVVVKYSDNACLRIIEESTLVCPIRESLELDLPIGTTVSLLGFGKAERVRTSGLRWPLEGETLAIGMQDGARNEVTDSPVRVEVGSGCVMLVAHTLAGPGYAWCSLE